jgi:hypothetical protein
MSAKLPISGMKGYYLYYFPPDEFGGKSHPKANVPILLAIARPEGESSSP